MVRLCFYTCLSFCPQGGLAESPPGRQTTPPAATTADSTHPTGMHSYFILQPQNWSKYSQRPQLKNVFLNRKSPNNPTLQVRHYDLLWNRLHKEHLQSLPAKICIDFIRHFVDTLGWFQWDWMNVKLRRILNMWHHEVKLAFVNLKLKKNINYLPKFSTEMLCFR